MCLWTLLYKENNRPKAPSCCRSECMWYPWCLCELMVPERCSGQCLRVARVQAKVKSLLQEAETLSVEAPVDLDKPFLKLCYNVLPCISKFPLLISTSVSDLYCSLKNKTKQNNKANCSASHSTPFPFPFWYMSHNKSVSLNHVLSSASRKIQTKWLYNIVHSKAHLQLPR